MTEETRWVTLPSSKVEAAWKRHEAEELRKAAYNAAGRQREAQARYRATHGSSKVKPERPFIIWDGEQPRDTGYSLFGNSAGHEICHPSLSTEECLELIIATELEEPDAIHIGFGFNFDVSWILKDLPWRALNRLKKTGRTFWHGYLISHVPRKWFEVKYGGITARIYEVFSFFNQSLVDTLTTWEIGPWKEKTQDKFVFNASSVLPKKDLSSSRPFQPTVQISPFPLSLVPSLASIRTMSEKELVEVFKWVRSEFLWKDIDAIRVYMRLELKYTKILMERLREIFLAAGYLPKSWHGPGALAREAFRRHDVYSAKAVCPPAVRLAARYAFIGGRFTPRLVGHFKRPVLSYDMNSAYPYAMTFLPNLAKGKWRLVTNPDEIRREVAAGRFGLYRIKYHATADVDREPEKVRGLAFRMFPLPRRNKFGGVGWPNRVTSWFWTPEAKLVINDDDAEYIGAWVFYEDDPADRPFNYIPEYFRRRQMLKRLGNPAEYTFKIILNAGFGQCAQRVGWDQKKNLPPRTHQLEWAGYITSFCRAAMYEMVQRVGEENVISIDTDGLYTFAPIPMHDWEVGDELGQWKCEKFDDMVVWQTGMYGLKRDGEWVKAKTRGIPKGKYKPESLIEAFAAGQTEITVSSVKFIGYGMALNGMYSKNNTWCDVPQTFKLGGSGALMHRIKNCSVLCSGDTHILQNVPWYFPADSADSEPHYLPWEDNAPDITAIKTFDGIGEDITWLESWNPDADEEWRIPDDQF
jgi:hypothetical protein